MTAQPQNFCNVLHSTVRRELKKTLLCSLANLHTDEEDLSLFKYTVSI